MKLLMTTEKINIKIEKNIISEIRFLNQIKLSYL